MREKILNLLEKNARIDIHDVAVMLGVAGARSRERNRGHGKGTYHMWL